MPGAGNGCQKASVGKHSSCALAETHPFKTLCGSHPWLGVSVGAGLGCLDKAEDPAQRTSQVIHPMEGSTTESNRLGRPVLAQASHSLQSYRAELSEGRRESQIRPSPHTEYLNLRDRGDMGL